MPPGRLVVALARCGFRCVECGSGAVRLDHAAGEWVPVITHWQLPDGGWCPATHGGTAGMLASLDLLDAMAAVMPVASYGEPVWHRRRSGARHG